MSSLRVWAEIDLDAVGSNLAAIRRRIGERTAIALVVKADAYGHGAVAIAHHAVRVGVAALGVRARILVLGTIVDDEAVDCLANQVEIVLHSTDRTRWLERLARRRRCRAAVHLKVDTGMGRLGVLPERGLDLLREIHGSRHLALAGLMTHVAAADGALSSATEAQLAGFDALVAAAGAERLAVGWTHACNSASVFTGLGGRYDAVRPGIAAYGVLPARLAGAGDLTPVLSLRSQVVFLKDLAPGASVGYDGTWTAARRTRVAVVPAGYNDGVPWRLSNAGHALVRGRRVPIIGRISMDYTMLDVTDVLNARVGDRVTLIGRDGSAAIAVEEIAGAVGTIPYEITCAIGRHVPRVYVGGAGAAADAPVRQRTRARAPALLDAPTARGI